MPNNTRLSQGNGAAGDAPQGPSEAAAAPPPPKICNGSNIFDCLVSGSLLTFFCLMSWRHGEDAFGGYALFRNGTVSGAVLGIITALSVAAVGLGFVLLYLRIKHNRYYAARFPKPQKPNGPSVWADMRDALEQMMGLKPYEGLDKNAIRAAPVKKRSPRDWLTQEKTRTGLSSCLLAILMYLTPVFIMRLMGMHVFVYFIVEFMMVMATLLIWIIAWIELGE